MSTLLKELYFTEYLKPPQKSNLNKISLRGCEIHIHYVSSCFSGGSVVKNPPAIAEDQFYTWAGKIPWRRKWQPTPVFLPEESHGQRSPAGHSPWDHKSQTRL